MSNFSCCVKMEKITHCKYIFGRAMTDRKKHDIAVIGAGPGGYVAAIKAAQNNGCTAASSNRGWVSRPVWSMSLSMV